MRRLAILSVLVAVVTAVGPAAVGSAKARPDVRAIVAAHLKVKWISAGANAWLHPPTSPQPDARARALGAAAFGTNVDAADPQEDIAGGQSETAIAAATLNGHHRVAVAWNDASTFFVQPSTRPRASGTGVGYSRDGGKTFRDLFGLPNDNPDEVWSGDPTVVAIDHGRHFIFGSLYFPSFAACFDGRPSQATIAVSVGTPTPNGGMRFSEPIVVAFAGNLCGNFQKTVALLDKDFMSWDQSTRTLAVSYTRFFLSGPHFGTGQIELVRAHVPTDLSTLSSHSFSRPVVVWPEEPNVENEGAYVALAPGGDAYVAWERNIDSNQFNGNPFVWINVAKVPAGASRPSIGGPHHRVVVTLGQVNATPSGAVRSLGLQQIPGYNRFIGNDFPRIAYDRVTSQVLVEWNDAELHPLGDIWLRAFDANLTPSPKIRRVNDDSDYTLHFMPAISVRADGDICSSWYDRRLSSPDSARTDYFGECRGRMRSNATDFRITTGSTDWTNTGSIITPNFGDYTDQTSDGNRTYFTWSDGRLGVPQPFVDHH